MKPEIKNMFSDFVDHALLIWENIEEDDCDCDMDLVIAHLIQELRLIQVYAQNLVKNKVK